MIQFFSLYHRNSITPLPDKCLKLSLFSKTVSKSPQHHSGHSLFGVTAASTFHEISVSQSQSMSGDSSDGQPCELRCVGRLQEIQAPEKKIQNLPTWRHRGDVTYNGGWYNTAYRTFREHRPPLPSGKVGDIWLDLSNRQVFYYDGFWKQWSGNAYPTRHPFMMEYKLYWSPVHQDVAWRSYSTITRLNKRHPGLKNFKVLDIFELVLADLLTIQSPSEPTGDSLKRKSDSDDNQGGYEDEGPSTFFGKFLLDAHVNDIHWATGILSTRYLLSTRSRTRGTLATAEAHSCSHLRYRHLARGLLCP